MLKLFSLVFVFIILISGLDLGLVKSSVVTREDDSLVRVKRIVDGQIAEKHRNSVFAYLSHGSSCTGTFIANNLILTAAHCCADFVASRPIKIYNEERTIEVTISAVHLNPIYVSENEPAEEDIAVIQLDRNVDSIRVAPLGNSYAISCNETVYGYGFGLTDPFKKKMSEQLKVFTAKVVQCSWFTYYKHYIPFVYHKDALMIESQDGIAFYGDSGGPVFNQDGSIIGVLSEIFYHRKLSGCSRIWKHKKFLREILSEN